MIKVNNLYQIKNNKKKNHSLRLISLQKNPQKYPKKTQKINLLNKLEKLKIYNKLINGNLIFIVYIVVFEMALNNSTNKSFKRLQRVFQMQNVLENQIHKKQELEHQMFLLQLKERKRHKYGAN